MKQTKFDYIKEKLTYVHSRVTIDKAFNMQDINIEAEDMFMHILNDVYDWGLINANKIKDNFPTVDLIGTKKDKLIQVTSSISTTKINTTLNGIEKFKVNNDLKKYVDYELIFLYIVEDKKDLSDGFKTKNNLTNENFLDITDILKAIQGDLSLENKVFETLQKIYVSENKIIEFPKGENPNKMLFTNYTEQSEPYYLEREEDVCFNQTLEISNIWVFGKSGRGKTSLINRNLIQSEIEYLFCDLSPITISSSNDILEEILSSIEEKFDEDRDPRVKNIVKSIVKLLKKSVQSKIVIVIDEMSVTDENLLKSIATSFIQLVTYYTNNVNEGDLRFVVSTIAEPRQIVLNTAKASEYFEYICCDNWEQHLENLFDSLNEALLLDIKESNRALIISSSMQSPRILKNIFRKMVIENNLTDASIQVIIKKVLQESL